MEDGAFAVFHVRTSADSSNYSDICGQLYAADGTAIGDEFRVNRVAAGSQTDVDATYRDGKFSVTWIDFRDGNFRPNAVYVQDLDLVPDGTDTSPTDIAVSATSVAENSAAGTVVAGLSAVDPSLDESFTFSLDSPSTWFEIQGDSLVVKAGVTLDYETASPKQEVVSITVTDGDEQTFTKAVTISLTDLTGAADPIRGTAGHDRALNGTGQADFIFGLAGNDIINGLGGVDTLYGGKGNDTYVIGSPVDTIVEAANEGSTPCARA